MNEQADWSDGYVTEIDYTYGYYGELNPMRAQWALLEAGYDPLPPGPEGRLCCELGFGQGLAFNIHAAAQPGAWWGTDFNPSHAAFAQRLAQASGARVTIADDTFAEFAARTDLPQFDFIVLHGIWSWVSAENRQVIVDFLRRRLKVGGMVYASYNTLPGWTSGLPLRHLMFEHANSQGAPGSGMVQRVDAALAFAQALLDVNPATLRANPQVAARLERVKKYDRHYLAHEFFNADWQPMYFSDVARLLAPAKLTFAASAAPLYNLKAINATPEQQALIDDIRDPVLRETVRDFCVNEQFRRDYWVRGAPRLKPQEIQRRMSELRVLLLTDPAKVKLTVPGPTGELTLREEFYRPILDELSDHRVRTVAELQQKLSHTVNWLQLREAIGVLIGLGALGIAQSDADMVRQTHATSRLNQHLMDMSRTRDDISWLASPVTGGGVSVTRTEQFFLAARAAQMNPSTWGSYAWAQLRANGERMLRDGNTLSTDEEMADLNAQAATFETEKLGVLKALKVAG